MTAPHAIINLLSGKVAAIAGEQPGRGPHGFVPETAKFDGQAIVDPNFDPSKVGQPGDPIGSFQPDPTPPIPAYDTTPAPTTPYEPKVPPLQTANPTMDIQLPSPTEQQRLIRESGAGVQPATPTLGDMNPTMGGPPGATTGRTPSDALPLVGQPTLGDMNPTFGGPMGVSGPPRTNTTPLLGGDMNGTDSLGNPYFGGPVGATSGHPLPGFLPEMPGMLDALHQTPSGIGNNPTFLPEDVGAQDPIVAAMLKSGAFPPFLQRLFAQQAGLAGLGTNVPQQTNLPAGVPLSSRLELSQMSPSELAAFQSFIIAHGIDWNDYLAMVDAASPQGGSAKTANPTIGFNPQHFGG